MENKSKKIVLAVLIIILLATAITFAVVIVKKSKQSVLNQMPASNSSNINNSENSNNKQEVKDGEVSQLTEEKKAEIASLKTVTAKITSISLNSIKATINDGEELSLSVPQSGASFTEQTTQDDGSFMNKEIGLLEVPKNKDVDIQYNSKTNEVMLVIIK